MSKRPEKNEHDVRTLIRKGAAEEDFQKLLACRAPQGPLLGLLTNLRHYSLSWDCFKSLTSSRLTRRKITNTLKKIRPTAHLIADLMELIYLAPIAVEVEEKVSSLPENIFFFCDHIERELRKRDYRRPPNWTHMLAMLVHFVRHTTGEFHDKEVSGLVSAVMSQTYDTTAHRQWRKRNKALLHRDLQA